jgi:uncharacterized HAD superfamily protein
VLTVKSVADLNAAIMANLHRIDRRDYDVIVGIPRSGMIPASILATQLQLPLADVETFARGMAWGRSGNSEPAKTRALLVDDTSNRGGAMSRAVARIENKASAITRFAVYGPYRGDLSIIDMFCEIVPGPRAFEWNMAKHRRLPRWGFDFDGVLCRDPTKEENDDGPRYLKFMEEAEPLFIPKRPIGHIVTGRLEKYRGETEGWLKRYGVDFESLTMTPFHSKAERMSAMKFAGGRGGWKSGIVKQLGVELFIESCPKQAGIIAREAGVPVWCTRTQTCLT